MSRLKKLKKIRIHREGTHTLAGSLLLLLVVNSALYFGLECKLPFYIVAVVSIVLYGMLVNFFRCPIRLFGQEDTEKIVVAPADGRIVVIEEVDENEYFHDRRLMISIFMSVINVHANWYPVDGRKMEIMSRRSWKYSFSSTSSITTILPSAGATTIFSVSSWPNRRIGHRKKFTSIPYRTILTTATI